ncbi:magnesium transporter [Phocea massiliensis]|jgi:magnesium transporter|uniref:Magnesium transporter MgtE n=1 Tax=uncultured Anaerotruncus sp. TaxID=905011 RepID=A0A6N2V145_9FIRM|nr:magnesium transporter [Merdimmobilis hominis]MCD4837197.1 magnesium transporter [Merdimmobilis hominis]
MENYELNFTRLIQMAEQRDYISLKKELETLQEVDVAQFLELLSGEKIVVVFRTLPKEMAAEVFANLQPETQEYIVTSITDQEIAVIIEDLFVDDAVDFLEELPANVVKRVLKNAGADTRAQINQFLNYPENSAGSIMTAEFTDLRKTMTVAQAIDHIRRTGEDRETIYTCYVIDDRRVLDGVVSVKSLLLADDEQLILDVMDTDIISVNTEDDREDVAQLFSKYGLLSLPVVDKENRLVGIVTVDDAVEVIEQEATEDFEKMAAMLPSERPYLKTSVFDLAKNRIMWLLVLMISAMITGGVLERYETAFAAMPLLVTFIPMLTDTGGNAGSQSSTLIIRGMAVSEIHPKDLPQVVWKELRVSVLVGLVLSVVNFIQLAIRYPGNELVALTVVLSLFATVVIAKTVGCVLPILAKMCHADPAIMAAPLITTVVDAFALIIYFSLAQRLLGL